MKRILVTGGAGFIGSNFSNINQGKYEVIALDNLFLGDPDNLNPEVQFIEGDACRTEDLNKAGKVDYVVHFAGTSSAPMFMEDGFVDGYVNSIQKLMGIFHCLARFQTGITTQPFAQVFPNNQLHHEIAGP